MGDGPHKTHEAYQVAPAQATALLDDGQVGLDEQAAFDAAETAKADALEATLAQLDELAEAPGQQGYLQLCELVAQGQGELDALDADEADKDAWRKQLAAKAAAVLAATDKETLDQAAADKGFAHPSLVSHSALTHWLNPAYADESESKAKIQAKAQTRYQQLAAGEVEAVHGQTLADVQATDQVLAPAAGAQDGGGWQASPAEVATTLASVNHTLAALDPPTAYGGAAHGQDGGLGQVLAAERSLYTAACPEMGDELAETQAAATGMIDAHLETYHPSARRKMIAGAVDQAVDDGTMPDAQARWMSREQQLALLRASTTPELRDELTATASQRETDVAALDQAHTAAKQAGTTPHASDGATIADWAQAHEKAAAAQATVASWYGEATDRVTLNDYGIGVGFNKATADTSTWRHWAKHQPLGTVREAAKDLGMEPDAAKNATRAQLQNYIAAGWDPSHSRNDIQAAAAAKHKTKKKQPSTPAGETPSKGSGPAAAAAGGAPAAASTTGPPKAKGSWKAKHQAAVAALKAHQGVASDVPSWQPHSEVAALHLSGGKPADVGGAHSKTLHQDPHGGKWLHKPDKHGGARAEAEAAGARLCHHAGVATPPVYVRDVDGKTGALQPWMSGASPLPTDPGQWSQAEVDSVVRGHVAAWMASNHDGNPSNWLRTPSGGLTPIDHGQAFKYFGKDKLSLDYDPNASYGNPPPAHLLAYKAATSDKLASGVGVRPEAALPAIDAFEAMPDTKLRSELAPVAEGGVKAEVAWVPRMRKAAQKRLGKDTVSDSDVAEEFLTQAVERKHNLRADFADFFTQLGFETKGLKQQKVA